jgi:hypothetical protein
MGAVTATRGSSAQLALAGFCTAMFTIALAALVSAQLSSMSVLDPVRAQRAAEQIATSRFTADVIEQTVERAVSPVAGTELATQLATATANDPRVTDVIASALLDAHAIVVDPDATTTRDGNAAVRTAIAESVLDEARAAGIDPAAFGIDVAALDPDQLATVAEQAGLPSVVPEDVPNLGLQRVADVTLVIAAIAMVVFGLVAILAHPRSGHGLRRLGVAAMIVCGAWLVGLVVTGWIIDLVSGTLFGEMLQTVWKDAVPSMLLLVGAGVVIGAGVVVGGVAYDGWSRGRAERAVR